MSLLTDKVFYNALKSNTELMAMVGYVAPEGQTPGKPARIYNTSIDVPDEELLNEPVPYIIITFDGMQNEGFTKDNDWEGDTDKVQVSIEVTAEDRETLGAIVTAIRQVVIAYFTNIEPTAADFDLVPDDYTLSAGQIQYDSIKPCYWQTLTYNCDTKP